MSKKNSVKKKSTIFTQGFDYFWKMISNALASKSNRCELQELKNFFESFHPSPEEELQYQDIYKNIYERVTLERTSNAKIPIIQTLKSFDVQKFGL